ncbi:MULTISPECIES: MarR family winged helix-turn-helix transcriptional regulator [Leucobacter]|uniref:MarR family transcriptional regulator n=1 Tax=Leucobacter manosquensis TaxID=2810611 RepID=A0ABS5M1V4_9MICO|nr:MarR family transcriptional regulator [Leucobacter manosquensis]MBS3181177.1 MarR family transcriptional regulator [Leucobacter manosquensis]
MSETDETATEAHTNDRFGSFLERARHRARSRFPEASLEDATATGLVLRRINRLMMDDAENEVLRPAGLSWTEFRVCFSLWVSGSQQPHEVATSTAMSRASVSTTMKGLKKKELVATRDSTTDLRSIMMTLTPGGIELVERAHAEHQALIEDWLSPLSPPERMILQGLLGKIMLGPRAQPYADGHAVNS